MTATIDERSIDKIHACIESASKSRETIVIVASPPRRSAHGPAAETDFGNHEIRPTKPARIQANNRHGTERRLDILSAKQS
jgi:hypothetical protein